MSGALSVPNSFANAVTATGLQLDQNYNTITAYLNDPTNRNNYAGDTSGSTNTIALSFSPAVTGYSVGLEITFKAANRNTGGVVVNANNLGNQNLFSPAGAALSGGEIVAGQMVKAAHDGTRFQMISQAQNVSVLPSGVIMDYAGSSVPSGWLECDGSAVSRATYPGLFTAIGTTWGAGDGSTTFNLPPSSGRSRIGRGTGTTTETITSQTASGNAVPVSSNNTKWITGMAVTVTNASGFTGLVNGSYFIIRASSTTVQFATTLANAQNGTAMTVTGTGSATLTTTFTARTLGETGGEEAHAMSISELIAHAHALTDQQTFHGPGGGGGVGMAGTSDGVNQNTQSKGGNAGANIMQLFAVYMTIIKT